MAVKSLPVDRRDITTRIERGRQLWEEHATEIRFDSRERVWLVPSQHEATSVYEVRLGRRGESCECIDFERHGLSFACKHIIAATIARAKTTVCSCCTERVPWRFATEVQEEHEYKRSMNSSPGSSVTVSAPTASTMGIGREGDSRESSLRRARLLLLELFTR
jgi:hypothetical protein